LVFSEVKTDIFDSGRRLKIAGSGGREVEASVSE
jgi:hypothetical protein